VKNFGINVTTMEDVFLRVAENIENEIGLTKS